MALKPGTYFLGIKAPGYLTTKTAAFNVDENSDIEIGGQLFNIWLAYAIIAGGILTLILVILKYSLPKRSK